MKNILLILTLLNLPFLNSGEVNSWDCNKFDGAKIISGDGEFLGLLGPRWLTDSIFNDSSSYASSWSQNSIFNSSTDYGNSYSNLSVFNEGASNPPMIISESGLVGYLSTGPSWDNERFSPYDIKYTCDWD
tara:strand:+ start:3544 stop:3936 length:393 start_codon:yes stop_codon:yes gene_type:complete